MSLRAQVVKGGAFLALRQGVGIVIGLAGVLLLTRRIGPESYGLYAAALGVFTYLQNLTLCGINVYLVRRGGEERRDVYDQASTLLLLLGAVGAAAAISVTAPLVRWLKLPGFEPLARLMFLLLPAVLVGQVAMARLERALNFRRVALLELAGQVVYFAVALPLAFRGFGMWAPTIAWVVQQLLLAAGVLAAASYWPRLHWSRALSGEMLTYGVSFSSSMWIWDLRTLVNPLVVGRFAGAEAVGVVALTIRLVEYLSFVKTATWRLSIAALGRVQTDAERLRRVVSEGIALQIVALGPLLVVFGWLAPWVIPVLFGPEWVPVLRVYPFIALAYLVNAVFTLPASALYVLRRNWQVATFHLVHVVLLAGVAIALVPRWEIVGYGLAELAALPSYVLLHRHFSAQVGAPRYGPAAAWALGMGVALFYRYAWWTTLALVPLVLLPSSRAELALLGQGFKRVRPTVEAQR